MGRVGTVTFSKRLIQCIRLTADGYTQGQIGAMLGISRRTVLLHLQRARLLTGAQTTAQLIGICGKLGLLDDGLNRDDYVTVERELFRAEIERDKNIIS